jgi:hypothetical protein
MVRKERLELSRRKALEPKSSVSTNFTTSAESGVDDGARTHDNRNHNPGLYQLSYAHHSINAVLLQLITIVLPNRVARSAGLEPATHGLEGRCSIQLSYERLTNHK